MGGAAAVLPGDGEVRSAIPQLGAEEHQHLPGEQGHIRAAVLQPETQRRGRGGEEAAQKVLKLWQLDTSQQHLCSDAKFGGRSSEKEYSLPRLQRVHVNEPLKGGHKCLQPLLQITHIFLQGGGKDSRQPRAFRHMHNVAKTIQDAHISGRWYLYRKALHHLR